MAFTFTDDNFANETKSWIQLVDFFAPWCGPCQMLWPVIDELSWEYEWKIKIWKINVDENTEIPWKYWVMSIPAIKIIKDWEVVEEFTWFIPKEQLKESLDKYL
jgi:thioredoxin 1